MGGAHRFRVIAEIKECLKNSQSTMVNSAHLMKAGVDMDFPEVFRALAAKRQIRLYQAKRCACRLNAAVDAAASDMLYITVRANSALTAHSYMVGAHPLKIAVKRFMADILGSHLLSMACHALLFPGLSISACSGQEQGGPGSAPSNPIAEKGSVNALQSAEIQAVRAEPAAAAKYNSGAGFSKGALNPDRKAYFRKMAEREAAMKAYRAEMTEKYNGHMKFAMRAASSGGDYKTPLMEIA